ncbi:MAG: CRISPR-associated endonuclease Cas2 [Bacteroidaceae bacterium]|nr:CRISPR-associated endonuclease Cas2 [Bacteroidaceae bacterium]
MGRRKYTDLPLPEVIRRLKDATMDTSKRIRSESVRGVGDECESLEVRVRNLMGIINDKERPKDYMQFFIMYDIESDKVRTLISKYLQKRGCTRVQNSIFIADLPVKVYEQIQQDLKEVQGCYDNHDSILVVPVPAEHLRSMCIIGRDIDLDTIMKAKSTLFF